MLAVGAWTAEQFDPALSWGDVEWIKKRWGGKLILKGVHGRRRCAPGGRQRRRRADRLQPRRPPARRRAVLHRGAAGIVEAVGSQIEVWMDSGIRSGQDVLKAMALGAGAP